MKNIELELEVGEHGYFLTRMGLRKMRVTQVRAVSYGASSHFITYSVAGHGETLEIGEKHAASTFPRLLRKLEEDAIASEKDE